MKELFDKIWLMPANELLNLLTTALLAVAAFHIVAFLIFRAFALRSSRKGRG